VAVLGGAVALVYRLWKQTRTDENKRLEKERERWAVRRDQLEEFYRSAVDPHHECKKISRTLRAESIRERKAWEIERGATNS
jgi:hypothetical protein